MGAPTNSRKRLSDLSPLTTPAKKVKRPPRPKKPAAILDLPPPAPLRRAVHGPQRVVRSFGLGRGNSASKRCESTENCVSRVLERKGFGSEPELEDGSSKGLGLEEYRRLVVEAEEEVRSSTVELPPAEVEVVRLPKEEDDGEETARAERKEIPLYRELYESSKRKRDMGLSDLDFEVRLTEKRLLGFRLADELLKKKPKEGQFQEQHQPFAPLTDEDEDDVYHAMTVAMHDEVLVTHKASNIEITWEVLQCLDSRAWLNDEIINLYLELLKERERREPDRFLKCHFFNTFFYKRLISGGKGYDFKAVRRWTTQRKIGYGPYGLFECDKIFVPIHKQVHWCLAIINIKDKKFQYLDSLGGMDKMVIRVLVRYMMDEVNDKNGKQIDAESWKQESVKNLPLQENGYDCGMFMLKYIDFYSRGLSLSFEQEHMPYFRKRTAKEILRLRAE